MVQNTKSKVVIFITLHFGFPCCAYGLFNYVSRTLFGRLTISVKKPLKSIVLKFLKLSEFQFDFRQVVSKLFRKSKKKSTAFGEQAMISLQRMADERFCLQCQSCKKERKNRTDPLGRIQKAES